MNHTIVEMNSSEKESNTFIVPMVETHMPMAIIYTIILVTMILLGITGNVTTLFLALRDKHFQQVGLIFIVNMAVADLCVVMVADPMCIVDVSVLDGYAAVINLIFQRVGVFGGQKWFSDRPILCQVVASFCLTVCFCSLLCLSVLTLNRYVYVCHKDKYDKIFSRTKSRVTCIATWILAFLLEMPNFFYDGGHIFDIKNHQCIWNRSGNFTYTLLVSAVFICGPFILIGSCLLSMFAKIVASKRVVNTGNFRARKALRDSISTARTLVGIFFLFIICWTPYAIVIVIDFKDLLSQEVHLFVTLLAHAHSSANFFVYIVCSRSFRTKVQSLFSTDNSVSPDIVDDGEGQSVAPKVYHTTGTVELTPMSR